jgi:hypothetical protein
MKMYTVFYAWQSDTDEKYNRNLIRIALDIAAKAISDDPSVAAQVAIDSDTQGVAGQPHVTDTLLEKIAGCDFFAPDLTFVGRSDAGKRLSNPNVMIEYGYALRAKPFTARMSIMNTEYGPVEDLPFDMGHIRYPLQYQIAPGTPDAQRRTVRARLALEIEAALRLMIASHTERAREEHNSAAVRAEMQSFRATRLIEIVAGRTPITLPKGGKVVLHLVPLPAFYDERLNDLISILVKGTHIPLPFGGFGNPGGVQRVDVEGFTNSNEGVPPNMLTYVRLFRSGAIESVGVISPRDSGGGCYFVGTELANKIMFSVRQLLDTLKSYDVGVPVCIMLSLCGGEYHFRYAPYGHWEDKKIGSPDSTVTFPLVLAQTFDVDVPKLMRPTLNILWNAFGFAGCDMYDGSGKWIGTG